MKLNPLIAKQPEDLEKLEFKKMKAIIKKELKRLQKYTSKEKPTQCILIGAHQYQDKPDMALPLFGKWKGKFKEFAKKKVVKDPMGAIGSVYFDGIDEESGQKVVRIQLAQGKGKNKVNKIQRTLKKLIPQASYNVVFSELSEEELNHLETKLDQTPDQQEDMESPDYTDKGEINVEEEGLNLKKLLTSNLKEISVTLADIKATVLPKAKTKTLLESDVDRVVNLLDLCEEWQEIYDEASIFSWTKVSFLKSRAQVELIQHQLEDYIKKLKSIAKPDPVEATAAADLPEDNPRKELTEQFRVISQLYQSVKTDILDRIRSQSTQEGDMNTIRQLAEAAEEWMITYNRAGKEIQLDFAGQEEQIQKVIDFNNQLQQKLKEGGVLKDTIPSLFKEGETPAAGMDEGLSQEAIQQMFNVQGLSNNCDATARYMVYKYMQDRGLIKMNDQHLLKNGQLAVYDTVLNKNVESIGDHDFKMNRIFSADGRLEIVQEGKTKGSYIPHPDFAKAINYINKHVANGIPVVVGISHTHTKDTGYNEGTTDHFIVIVGKKGDGYFYIDPGTWNGNQVENNFLAPVEGKEYLFRDASGAMSSKGDYVLTTVAVFGKDRKSEGGNDDWQEDDGLASDAAGLDEHAIASDAIKESVGRGGKNSARDAMIIQQLLLDAGENLGSSGPNQNGVDGDAGNKTFQAIESFQEKNGLEKTGLVEPGSATWKALNGITTDENEPSEEDEQSNTLTAEAVQFQYKGSASKLSAKAEQVLREILAKAGEPQAAIVNTLRSDEEQANVMYANIEAYGPAFNRNQYKDKAAAGKVVDAYEAAKAAGKGDTEIVGAILAVIKAVGADKLSDHCNSSNPAIDIHPASIKNKATFEQILKADGRVTVICPPKDSNYHIIVL